MVEKAGVNVNQLIDKLKKAAAAELTTYYYYTLLRMHCTGLEGETVKEIAEDEKKHEEMFRELIGSYLDGVPSMGMAETHPASTVNKILEVNLKDEKHAVDIYLGILKKVHDMKDELKYEYFQLEHNVRHIITDEQEHIAELKLLRGKKK